MDLEKKKRAHAKKNKRLTDRPRVAFSELVTWAPLVDGCSDVDTAEMKSRVARVTDRAISRIGSVVFPAQLSAEDCISCGEKDQA